jgi:hypothetical protein
LFLVFDLILEKVHFLKKKAKVKGVFDEIFRHEIIFFAMVKNQSGEEFAHDASDEVTVAIDLKEVGQAQGIAWTCVVAHSGAHAKNGLLDTLPDFARERVEFAKKKIRVFDEFLFAVGNGVREKLSPCLNIPRLKRRVFHERFEGQIVPGPQFLALPRRIFDRIECSAKQVRERNPLAQRRIEFLNAESEASAYSVQVILVKIDLSH